MIFIPSKGRAGSAKCIETLLAENNQDLRVIVEPQDEEKYAEAYPKATLLVLEKNDQGIAYVRNFLLKFARDNGIKHFWQLDDDINVMAEVVNKKTVKKDFSFVLKKAAEDLISIPNLAVGALEYQQYAWAAKKKFAFNSYCDTCVLINTENTLNLKYRDGVKEDRDMVLQALEKGFLTARVQKYCFGSPKNGTNKGGLHDKYKAGLEVGWSKRMVELWPGICELNTKPDGRPDVKINWSLFKSNVPRT